MSLFEDPFIQLAAAWIALFVAGRLYRHLTPTGATRGSAAHVADAARTLALTVAIFGLAFRTITYALSLLNSR